ncbi:MAG: nitroreductase family protein [Chitinivibrionales bacterium]|nr:nitroreductase family protein [Chitinivibrionales bacterium]
MNRREAVQSIAAGAIGLVAPSVFFKAIAGGAAALPSHIVNSVTVEAALNSHLSFHDGYSGPLPDQILANLLWAAAKAPTIGATREIYLARADGVYIYDSAANSLTLRTPGDHLSETKLACEIGVGPAAEDAGAAHCFAQLAASAFWKTASDRPVCCPKASGASNANAYWDAPSAIKGATLCVGRKTLDLSEGIKSNCVALSSDKSLAAPDVAGKTAFETALAGLHYGPSMQGGDISMQQLSQILWAAYGCAPHSNVRRLTIASAMANYYLTDKIYAVCAPGLYRYHNCLPGSNHDFRDHRLEALMPKDLRTGLRAAIARVPAYAGMHLVLCSAGTKDVDWELWEAGACGAAAVLQASALGFGGFLTGSLTNSERTAIVKALKLPADELPLLVVSIGFPAKGAAA